MRVALPRAKAMPPLDFPRHVFLPACTVFRREGDDLASASFLGECFSGAGTGSFSFYVLTALLVIVAGYLRRGYFLY